MRRTLSRLTRSVWIRLSSMEVGQIFHQFITIVLLGVKSKVCILPGETYSESNLKENGVFDGATVNIIVKAMTVYPDATFLGKTIK